jgi:hypothetical protein
MTEGGKEFIVNALGRYVAIIKTEATTALKLGYVGVFATSYDCSKIILPNKVKTLTNQSYPIVDALCNPIINSIVLQGPYSLPSFMSFNAITKNLTINPADSDTG